MKILFTILLFLFKTNCYIISSIPINNINFYKQSNIIKINSCIKPDNIFSPIKLHYGEKIVKSLTEFLPTADAIAPFVLHTNEYMINILLNIETIPISIRKILILNVIKISLLGDHIGSTMLHMYYDIVKYLL